MGGAQHRTSGSGDQARGCSLEPVDLEEEVIEVLSASLSPWGSRTHHTHSKLPCPWSERREPETDRFSSPSLKSSKGPIAYN